MQKQATSKKTQKSESMISADSLIWDDYWRSGQMACCFNQTLGTGYEGRLAAFWRDYFNTLVPRSRILDICTGNGGIAAIAQEVSNAEDSKLAVTGIDWADINPASAVPSQAELLSAIDFRGNIDAASLPFADGEFHRTISQYGLEYTDLNKSLSEAIRVLRPDGRFLFVMHAAEGRTAQDAAHEARLINDLAGTDVFAAARRAINSAKKLDMLQSPGPVEVQRSNQDAQALNDALARLQGLIKEKGRNFMLESAGALIVDTYRKRTYFDAPILLAKIDESARSIAMHKARLDALAAAARTSADMETIRQMLSNMGASDIRIEAIEDDQGGASSALVAYAVSGAKA